MENSSDSAPLGELYQELIVEASRARHHRGTLEGLDGARELVLQNPLCGDTVRLWLQLANDCVKGERVKDVKFCGQGCMISQAAASLLADGIKGADVASVRKLIADFRRLIQGTDRGPDQGNAENKICNETVLPQLGDLVALRGVRQFPSRTRCALLACEALERLLDACKHEETFPSSESALV